MRALNPIVFVAAGVLITVLVSAFLLYGNLQYKAGRKDLSGEIAAARADSVEEAERIRNEVDKLEDDDLLNAILGYVRGDS